MTERIGFDKLSGSGNDFICIDGRDGRLDAVTSSPERLARFARALCHRGLGVGADGVILAAKPNDPQEADLGARFLEPDGSEAELCGNGSACITRWAVDNGWVKGREVRLQTPSGVARGRATRDGYVRVCIPEPHDLATDIEVVAEGVSWRMDFAITGVPHAVVYVDDVSKVDVARWGRAIRHHERFAPRGVNVNFTQVLGVGELAVRTFEFGVEAETLACGTGSSTAALMAALRFGWPTDYTCQGEPVRVHVHSGDVLKAFFLIEEDGTVSKACLETVVRCLYTGSLHPELAERALGKRGKTG